MRPGHPVKFARAYDPLFESAWLKWGQACIHTKALQAEIETWRGEGATNPILASRAQYQSKRHGFAVIAQDLASVPFDCRLLFGDIAGNFRAALDHLAWALVCRGNRHPDTLCDWEEKAVYFPIFKDREKFNSALSTKLPGVRRTDIAKVRARQPYHNGRRTRDRHALWMLYRINNRDKHRVVEPLWMTASDGRLEVDQIRDCVLTGQRASRPKEALKVGAEFAFIRARKTGPNPEIDVEAILTAEPSLDYQIGAQAWYAVCCALIGQLLSEFSEQPPRLKEFVGDLRFPAALFGR